MTAKPAALRKAEFIAGQIAAGRKRRDVWLTDHEYAAVQAAVRKMRLDTENQVAIIAPKTARTRRGRLDAQGLRP